MASDQNPTTDREVIATLDAVGAFLRAKCNEIERLRVVIRTMVVNLERGSRADSVAAWGREEVNDER